MKKPLLKITIVVSSFILLFSNICIATSQQDLNNVQNKIDGAKTELNGVQNEKSEKMKEVESLTEQIDSYQSQIDELDTKIAELNTQIGESENKLKEAENKYTEQEDLLNKRLVATYMAGETSYLDFLLSSSNIVDLISNYYLVSEIADADTQLLKQIDEQKKEIEETKKTLEANKQEVATTKASKQSVATQLQSAKNEKNAQVANLSSEEKELQNKIDEYQEEMNKIEAEMKRIAAEAAARAQAQAQAQAAQNNSSNKSGGTSNNTTTHNGAMKWPCPNYSYISSYFGGRSSPGGGVGSRNHKGVDLAAPHGSSILAAGSGTVITVSNTCRHDYPKTVATKCSCGGGFGNYVMISHGNGLVTVYAHCSSINVSNGQSVSAGQQIATVGTTGYSTGYHLHFGALLNGSYVNPLPYIQ